ncbi:peroxidase mlt-7-like [Watersipora subatra]|uniref:peroxidase mlt-7-like n=1 Tax=Watersipora subatra TaxID=2589382 RepID=UPI00355C3C82
MTLTMRKGILLQNRIFCILLANISHPFSLLERAGLEYEKMERVGCGGLKGSALQALLIKADITPSPNANCIDLDVCRAEKTGQLLLHSLVRKKKEETKAEEGEDEEFEMLQSKLRVDAEFFSSCEYDDANEIFCNTSFREPTARCTNLKEGRKTWGMVGTPYTRILPPAYQDGAGEIRQLEHSSHRPLTSPRTISTTVTTTNVILNFEGLNSEIMQWGQFSAHEFTHISDVEAETACCPDQIFAARHGTAVEPTEEDLEAIRQELRETKKDVCMQIETSDDAHYGGYLCMTQRRSRSAPLHDCYFGQRQQINTITHVFDGSAVYGSSKEEQNKLRASSGGKMKTQTVNGMVLPPPDQSNCPVASQAVNRCPFLGGDTRINVTPNLASTHAAFLVKHNRIAEELSTINPHWDNERLFQETRRIITGIESSIHYYEYLPIVLGTDVIYHYQLDRYRGYNKNVNPSVLNELAHAAYRFGHSTVGGFFSTVKDDGTEDFVSLIENFNKVDLLYDGGYQQFLRGLQKDVPWLVDRNFPSAMRNSLFAARLDIVALNINRGRDHGFPPYVAYRQYYGLSVPQTFDDLRETHPQEVIDALRQVYSTVADVELYIAGVTEIPKEGAIVGELFALIIADGFSRIRDGDRLFFESLDNGLSRAQIETIKGYKYNKLLCDATAAETTSSSAFLIPGKMGATRVECSSLPQLNLELWREYPGAQPGCTWEIINEGPCCFGQQTLTRMCNGGPYCSCQGSAIIRKACRCYTYECIRNLWNRCY